MRLEHIRSSKFPTLFSKLAVAQVVFPRTLTVTSDASLLLCSGTHLSTPLQRSVWAVLHVLKPSATIAPAGTMVPSSQKLSTAHISGFVHILWYLNPVSLTMSNTAFLIITLRSKVRDFSHAGSKQASVSQSAIGNDSLYPCAAVAMNVQHNTTTSHILAGHPISGRFTIFSKTSPPFFCYLVFRCNPRRKPVRVGGLS
jgi:hypothetical protein